MDAPDASTAPGPPAQPRPIDDPRATPILTAEQASLTAATALVIFCSRILGRAVDRA